ncbi:MAG: PA14 domain-containing protein, partial [Planctomycetota bacterium]|nr:PA14 domain-containing protein [Planctomycetota bacterium]
PAEGDGKAKGLRGEYFGSISFVDTKLVRLDSSINFDWGAGAPAPEVSADNFSCRWTGKLKPPRTGVYYFYTISDDGVRLWLDNRLLIDNWTDHAPTENSTSGYEERYPLFQRLAACAASAEETAEIWQKACEMFPGEAQPRADLAEALALAGKDDAAIAAYEEALKLISGRQESQHLYANFFSRLIAICCSRQRLEQAAELLLRYAPNNENIWITHQALYAIQGAGSAYSSMAAALKLAEAGGWRRVAAAEYLCQTPYRDLARSCLWAAVADQSLPGNYRYRLFDLLANLARDPGERAEMRRQQAAATSEIWQKSHALQMLARDLATEGKIGEALAVVEEADGVRQDNWSAGPQALAAMAQSVLQGRRVGPGLRSAEGLAKAENAVLDLYQRWRERDECAAGFSQLVTQLCQVRQQRGEHEAGLALLRRAVEVRDQSSIRLEIALLAAALAEAGKAPDPMPEFAAYAEAVAAEHNRAVAQNQNRRYALPNFDHRIGSLLERQKRQADFEKEISSRLEQRQGAERQALAEVLLSYQKQQGRLAEMEALLKKMDEWGFKDKLYTQEAEWVRRGLALKNAKSRADAEQRQRLLQDVARWEEVTKANAEDYQALFNLAKCHALLGDEDKSRQLVETARQRWPKDPVVLEIYARERMLDKGYAEAAQALAQAAEITGRRLDYEETMCSAYEMAGRFDLAIVLALDALESGLRSGQGFRTPEQIFDLAERSDNLAFLRQNLAARLQKKAEKTPNANLARLALRVAWQEADESLADAALSQLIFLAQQGNALTAEAALMPLAQQAEERQRLADAMRLRQAAIDVVEARGEAPRLSDYEALARLFLRAGKAVEAADLMFAGLRRALETGRPTPSSYKEMQFGRRRRDAQMAAAPFMPLPGSMQNQRLPWVQSIFNFVAAEHAAGGEAFRVAAGERLQALVEEEMKILAAKPRLYAGPLLNPGLEKALSLGERITAAFKQQCQKPDASADDHLALAERLTNTAVLTEDAGAPRPAFAEIAAACSAALEKAEPPAKPAIARSRCRIYRRLFALPAQA